MSIFNDMERKHEGPASDRESHFFYLNRSARKDVNNVRRLIDDWFYRYPDDHKDELRVRLRSNVNRHFKSAFFELYLHELLTRLGYQVEIHPVINIETEARPDFLATRSGGADFYLEGVLATDLSDADVGAENRMDEVYEALNDIESPNFFIGINIRDMPPVPVPKRKLKKEVRSFLSKLDPDLVDSSLNRSGVENLPQKTFSYDGWTLEYYAIPKSPKLRGKNGVRSLGIRMHMPELIDSRTPIRDAIRNKSTKYGNLGKPYIIAVNAFTQHLDKIAVMEALFGKETYLFSPNSFNNSELPMVRTPDGAWYGPQGVQNTRVSAILISPSIMPWSVGGYTPTIYHNPWAQFPCQDEMIQLTRCVPRGERMETIDGIKGKDVFGLEDNWPS